MWTAKALARFKQRIREITSRSRGNKVGQLIDKRRGYVIGWMNPFGGEEIAGENWRLNRVKWRGVCWGESSGKVDL